VFAIRQHAFGGPEELRYEQVEDPVPAPGQVRIVMAAAGIHLVDTTIRSGTSGGPFPLPDLPMTPGREMAGTVDAVGDGVDPAWVGTRVVAHLGVASGGYAEMAVTGVGALHRLPDGVTFTDAAAMVGTGRTTMAIVEVAALTADDVVLVTAAAGGIGSLVVQIARHRGATVVGLAGGPAKVGAVEQLGADAVFDYTGAGWPGRVRSWAEDRPVTVALDGVGGPIGREVLDLVAPGGRLVLFGSASGEVMPLSADDLYRTGVTVTAAVGARMMSSPRGFRPWAERALAELAAGTVRPLVHPPFRLADAAEAHRALAGRATTGKVVLVP
jgi:NADPH2:quinone reductase